VLNFIVCQNHGLQDFQIFILDIVHHLGYLLKDSHVLETGSDFFHQVKVEALSEGLPE
jgi:hypothetical protein